MQYILIADMHLRYDTPIARTDDFINTQMNKLDWLVRLQDKFPGSIILNAGDTTHYSREGKQNEFLNFLSQNLPKMTGIGGNHCLLYKSMKYLHSSTLGVLQSMGIFDVITKELPFRFFHDDVIYGFNYGEEIESPKHKGENKTICLTHQMVFKSDNDFLSEQMKGKTAKELLTAFPEYDIILSGDNHTTFVVEHEGRYLVNPGSFLRLTADQEDHEPCVFVYDSDTHKITKHEVPIEHGVISRQHLDIIHDKDERLQAFVRSVNDNYEIGFSFEQNMEEFFGKNNTDESIKTIIYQCMEG